MISDYQQFTAHLLRILSQSPKLAVNMLQFGFIDKLVSLFSKPSAQTSVNLLKVVMNPTIQLFLSRNVDAGQKIIAAVLKLSDKSILVRELAGRAIVSITKNSI